jgi:hypothetical protein
VAKSRLLVLVQNNFCSFFDYEMKPTIFRFGREARLGIVQVVVSQRLIIDRYWNVLLIMGSIHTEMNQQLALNQISGTLSGEKEEDWCLQRTSNLCHSSFCAKPQYQHARKTVRSATNWSRRLPLHRTGFRRLRLSTLRWNVSLELAILLVIIIKLECGHQVVYVPCGL